MNMNQIPQDKLNALLQTAGKKLGKNPQQLRAELENGNVDSIVSNMDPKTAGQLHQLLKNPDALKSMLENDKVKNLLNKLGGGNR